jgi:5-methylcytosine-specific restriction endonuclease McrA
MADYPALPLWSPYGGLAERHVDWSKHPSRLLNSGWRKIRRAVLDNHHGGCVTCGAEYPLEVDHIIPRCRGGTHEWANLQVLCRTCNRRKGGRDG